MSGIGYLDLFILAVIAIGAWRGLRSGAIRQVIGVTGGIIAIVFGASLSRPVGAVVTAIIGLDENFIPLVGFITICVGAFALAGIVGHTLRTVLKTLNLGFIDTMGGAFLGSLKVVLMLSVFFIVTSSRVLPAVGGLVISDEVREQSALYHPVEMAAPAVWDAFRAVAPGWQENLLNLLTTEEENED